MGRDPRVLCFCVVLEIFILGYIASSDVRESTSVEVTRKLLKSDVKGSSGQVIVDGSGQSDSTSVPVLPRRCQNKIPGCRRSRSVDKLQFNPPNLSHFGVVGVHSENTTGAGVNVKNTTAAMIISKNFTKFGDNSDNTLHAGVDRIHNTGAGFNRVSLVNTSHVGAIPERPSISIAKSKSSTTIGVPSGENTTAAVTSKNDTDVVENTNTSSTKQLSPCRLTSNGNEATVDCRYLDLNHLSPAWFPESTTQIYLDNNNLMKIPDQIFNHLSRLEVLSISYNKINAIDENAFVGLESLQKLNLDMNQLDISDKKLTFRVFNPLKNLIELRMIFNKATYSRSITLPQSLYKLKLLTLSINDDNLYFGEDFKLLADLHRLEMSGSSQIITKQTFENVGATKELYMYNFEDIFSVDEKAFEPLKKLTVLLLDHFYIGVKNILKRLAPFKGRKMELISLKCVTFSTTDRYPSMHARDGELSREDFKHVLQICVREFALKDSYIYILEPSAFDDSSLWDVCLQKFDISFNSFAGIHPGLLRLMFFNNLQLLNAGDSVKSCDKTHPPRVRDTRSVYSHFEEPVIVFPELRNQIGDILITSNQINDTEMFEYNARVIPNSERNATFQNIGQNFLSFNSVNFQTFNMSSSIKVLKLQRLLNKCSLKTNLVLSGAQNVKFIDLSENGCEDFKGKILGLTGLESLILAGNNMAVLSDSFFKPMPSLRNLVMSACQLDSDQMSKKSDQIFGHLKNLVTLDLSSNSLHSLSKRTFHGNTELAFLNLTDNNFQYVPFDLAARPNLRELDLRGNLIASLSVRETQDMDDLVSEFGNFNLHLSDNILSCGCQSLQFLQWLVKTRVTLDEDGNFTCMNDDGELTFTSEYRDLEKVWRHCGGTFYFALSLVLFCFMTVGFLTCYIVTKYKTFIMCSLIQIVGGFKRKTKIDYDTGVFIGYADEEYRFPCIELREFIEKTLGLSTYIKDRDSPVSSNKANSLVTAINSSWRIVLVCSQSFLRDDQWAVFTMKWAMLSQTPANPARVIVLVREDLLDDLPAEVVSGVESESIIVLPSWELDYGVEQKLRTLLV